MSSKKKAVEECSEEGLFYELSTTAHLKNSISTQFISLFEQISYKSAKNGRWVGFCLLSTLSEVSLKESRISAAEECSN